VVIGRLELIKSYDDVVSTSRVILQSVTDDPALSEVHRTEADVRGPHDEEIDEQPDATPNDHARERLNQLRRREFPSTDQPKAPAGGEDPDKARPDAGRDKS